MLSRKIITIIGSSVVTVALLSGVTYAWFTNVQTATAGIITAGKLGIEFQVNDDGEVPNPTLLYPQLTLVDEDGNDYPDPDGTIEDVVTNSFTLTNDSDRQVLVKVSGANLIEESVKGSALDDDLNAIEGSYPVVLTDTDAVKISYDFGIAQAYRKENDAYIFLPTGTSATDISIKVWIDGETSGNEYQYATIDLNDLTATAVQYREAAILDTFPELDSDIAEIEKFGDFE